MNQYDIVFVGHLAMGTIVPFGGPPYAEWGGPAFFGPLAASCLTKRIASVTRIAESEEHLLEPLKAAGIDLYSQHREAAKLRVVHPNASVDERQIFLIKRGGYFCIDDMPPIEPCLIHLGGLSDHEFPMEFMRALKARGFRLSVDMQSFVWQVDDRTGCWLAARENPRLQNSRTGASREGPVAATPFPGRTWPVGSIILLKTPLGSPQR